MNFECETQIVEIVDEERESDSPSHIDVDIAKPFECPVCKLRIKYKNNFELHLKIHRKTASKFQYETELPLKTTMSQQYCLDERTSTFNPHDRPQFQCHLCTVPIKSYSSMVALQQHIRAEHLNQQAFQCLVCQSYIKYDSGISKHMQMHFLADGFYRCRYCAFKSKTQTDLTEHKRVCQHKNKLPLNMGCVNDVNYECYLCRETYRQKNSLRFHMQKIHCGLRAPFVCSQCSRGFCTKQQVEKHEETHDERRLFYCPQCDKPYKSEFYVKKHIDRVHSNRDVPKKFSCDQCDMKFRDSGVLKRHMKSHSDERPFKCSYCGKGFKIVSYVKIHERIHTGEKPYTCQFCGKSFSQQLNWRYHVNTHTKEPHIKCDYCSKKFRRKEHLVAHIQIHTGERKFQCELCSRKFARNGDYKRHLKVNHTADAN